MVAALNPPESEGVQEVRIRIEMCICCENVGYLANKVRFLPKVILVCWIISRSI